MTNLEKLAQLFKERNNPNHINITTGVVISINPLQIKWGDSVILKSDSLVKASGLSNIELNDTIIMIPDLDYKKWYLIDKVG